ncbi:MAG: hypothetical protein ACI303_06460, partial [Lepagella sp.]
DSRLRPLRPQKFKERALISCKNNNKTVKNIENVVKNAIFFDKGGKKGCSLILIRDKKALKIRMT